ncbi:MAG: OmpA family protein [Alphaproteobacteria bacterium]|nr:OmpA family protein [Alphaproteobacteria bacterium]
MPFIAAAALLLAAQSSAPAPPETPPAAHIIPGPFMLFFDWDSSEISPRSAEVLDYVISIYRTIPGTRILITGHTDRSGSAAANLRLSCRRAEQAKAYLTRHGIADALVTIGAFGEAHRYVETPDGRRDEKNRRVEISFGTWDRPRGRCGA